MIYIFNTYYAIFVRMNVICNLIILKTLYKYIESIINYLIYLSLDFGELIIVLSLNNENLYQYTESVRYVVMYLLGIVGSYYGNI